MKRIISMLLLFIIMLTVLEACGGSDENKALKTIQKFIASTEKGDTKACIECLDPDLQTIAKNSADSIGNALGLSNAFDTANAFSSVFNSAFAESTDTKIVINQKEIKSKNIEKDSAVFCIEYNIKISSKLIENPIESSGILGFKMTKKSGKWYIFAVNAVSENADTDILANGKNIINGKSFSDGVALIEYKNNENYVFAAIDTNGKTLFEFENEKMFDSYFSSGILVIDNEIYDKKGRIIASPEKTGYDEIVELYETPKNIDGYVIVTKTEESFSGDKYLFGIINNKGDWEIKLSENGKWEINNYIFSWSQESDLFGQRLQKSIIGYESRDYQGETPGIYQYNTNGSSSTMDTKTTHKLIVPNIITDSTDFFFDEVFVGGESYDNKNLYDYTGNLITNLSKYNITNVHSNHGRGIYYKNEHLLCCVNNETDSRYLCLIDKNGQTAFEPIRLGSGDDFFPLDETGFVVEIANESNYNNRTYKLYNYKGNVTEYKDVIDFYGFNDGLALVRNAAGQYYYINIKGEQVIK